MEGPMRSVWIYVDTSKQVGDKDHLKVFATEEAAERWFTEHDPEGVAYEYPVMGAAWSGSGGFQTQVDQPKQR
jgi:hypothetical protein